MKRKGKCVNKKAYSNKGHALFVARKWYIADGTEFGIYECPSCLDFHLTSKYCNTQKYHKRWVEYLAKQLQLEERKFDKKKLLREKKKRTIVREKKRVVLRKQTTLPLSLQRELLQNLDKNPYPQPPTFWESIRGIIIGTGR